MAAVLSPPQRLSALKVALPAASVPSPRPRTAVRQDADRRAPAPSDCSCGDYLKYAEA